VDTLETVFYPYPECIRQKLDSNWEWVWQPASAKGLSVISSEAAYVLGLVDGKRSVGQIWKECQRVERGVQVQTVRRVLTELMENQLIWLNRRAEVDQKRPEVLGVWFHQTNQCNLRCKYCYVNKTDEAMKLEMARKILAKVVSSAKAHGFKLVKVKFTGGEALLEYEKLLKAIEHLKQVGEKEGINTQAVVLTNAVLMTAEKAATFRKLGVRVMVSLDGLQPQHDAVRVFANGAGSYLQVMRGIEHVVKAKIPFNVSITITDKNVEGIPELTSLLLKKGIPFVYNFFRENCMASTDLRLSNDLLIRKLTEAYRIIGKHGNRSIYGLLDRVSFGSPHGYACGVGRNYLVVDHKGRIAACQTKIGQTIGTATDVDPIAMMKSQKVVTLNHVDKREHCNLCPWRYICAGGCPLLEGYPYCSVYKTLIPKLLQIQAEMMVSELKNRKLQGDHHI